MKRILLALTLCSLTGAAALADRPAPPKPAPAKVAREFPVPKDATGGESQPGGGGKILLYKIPRGKNAVVTELREALKKANWKITKDDTSPRGAVRMEVEQAGAIYRVSVTGDDAQAALILTVP